jgi:DNA modification methylase
MTESELCLERNAFGRLSDAARDRSRVSGYTHNFYRYPARFSPTFAATAIEMFSEPGDIVLDPYMGGGTVVIEAAARGRHAVGNDLNSLAVFLAKTKTTCLKPREAAALLHWANSVVPLLSYRDSLGELPAHLDDCRTKNLHLPRGQLPSKNVSEFARCAVLNVAQWALDGRRSHTSVSAFKEKLTATTIEMLGGMDEFKQARRHQSSKIHLRNGNANSIDLLPIFATKGQRAKLIVTSPPYPGVHMLYHRWQVDGRRETPAPYWITQRTDGQGASYYCFGARSGHETGAYFANAFETLRSIRRVLAPDGLMVQLIAFSKPDRDLPRYLEVMQMAGFEESLAMEERIWREVPNRKWHATVRGLTHSAKEVLLVHTPA